MSEQSNKLTTLDSCMTAETVSLRTLLIMTNKATMI